MQTMQAKHIKVLRIIHAVHCIQMINSLHPTLVHCDQLVASRVAVVGGHAVSGESLPEIVGYEEARIVDAIHSARVADSTLKGIQLSIRYCIQRLMTSSG